VDQVVNVCRTTIVRDAWRNGQDVTVHGWVYGLKDGLLRDLNMCITKSDEIESSYAATIHDSAHGIEHFSDETA
jgi:carbonic anhydrase